MVFRAVPCYKNVLTVVHHHTASISPAFLKGRCLPATAQLAGLGPQHRVRRNATACRFLRNRRRRPLIGRELMDRGAIAPVNSKREQHVCFIIGDRTQRKPGESVGEVAANFTDTLLRSAVNKGGSKTLRFSPSLNGTEVSGKERRVRSRDSPPRRILPKASRRLRAIQMGEDKHCTAYISYSRPTDPTAIESITPRPEAPSLGSLANPRQNRRVTVNYD